MDKTNDQRSIAYLAQRIIQGGNVPFGLTAYLVICRFRKKGSRYVDWIGSEAGFTTTRPTSALYEYCSPIENTYFSLSYD